MSAFRPLLRGLSGTDRAAPVPVRSSRPNKGAERVVLN